MRDTATFAWVLVPGLGMVPKLAAEYVAVSEDIVRVRIAAPEKEPTEVTVPLKDGEPSFKGFSWC